MAVMTENGEREALNERLIQRRRARQTGTHVEVWEGFDGNPGYQTICVEHGGICDHDTRAVAVDFAPVPEEWCPTCQDNRDYGDEDA